MKDRGGRAQSDFNRVGRAQEKSTGAVFGRGSPSCILFPCTTSKPNASAKHSRAKSLVTLEFSCWGYSCSCAYFQLLMRNVAVAQMTLGRSADALAWTSNYIPFEPLQKQDVRDAEKEKRHDGERTRDSRSRGRVQWP